MQLTDFCIIRKVRPIPQTRVHNMLISVVSFFCTFFSIRHSLLLLFLSVLFVLKKPPLLNVLGYVHMYGEYTKRILGGGRSKIWKGGSSKGVAIPARCCLWGGGGGGCCCDTGTQAC